jgi:hypothetical protein
MSDNRLYFDIFKTLLGFAQEWTTLPIILPNEDEKIADISGGFVVFDLKLASSDFVSINAHAPRVRTRGIAAIEIYTKQNTGVGQNLVYAGEIAAKFRGRSALSGKLICYEPNIGHSFPAENPNGKFYLRMLNCPFLCDTNTSSLV